MKRKGGSGIRESGTDSEAWQNTPSAYRCLKRHSLIIISASFRKTLT